MQYHERRRRGFIRLEPDLQVKVIEGSQKVLGAWPRMAKARDMRENLSACLPAFTRLYQTCQNDGGDKSARNSHNLKELQLTRSHPSHPSMSRPTLYDDAVTSH
jgi:hypothetical protein